MSLDTQIIILFVVIPIIISSSLVVLSVKTKSKIAIAITGLFIGLTTLSCLFIAYAFALGSNWRN